MASNLRKLTLSLLVLALVGGCAQFPRNDALDPGKVGEGYNFDGWEAGNGDVFVAVSMSGGGARAAAFAFGVLEAMHLTTVGPTGESLLQEVDVVSSTSGGSITAAYWATHGRENLLADFPADFLEKDMQGGLTGRLLWPNNWFRLMGEQFERVDLAAEYLDEELFGGTTFLDVQARRESEPFFLINATDGSWGTRFGFTQDSFDVLCSDLGTYPLSRAVAASGAVPVASSPITLESFGWEVCRYEAPDWVRSELEAPTSRQRLRRARAIDTYGHSEDGEPGRKWTHLFDGGVADNLGAEGLYDVVFPIDGCTTVEAPRHIVVIVVDSVLELDHCTDYEIAGPGLGQTLSALANVTIDRLSDSNADRLHAHLAEWAERCTDGGPPDIDTIFVRIPAVEDPRVHDLLQVDTSLSLPCESVDALRCAGRNVFDSMGTDLIPRLPGRAAARNGGSAGKSACARPDQADHVLECDLVVPIDDYRQLNKDTPTACGVN